MSGVPIPPSVPGAESLPPSMQLLLTAGAAFVAAVVYFIGILRKPNLTVAKDVVVPNVNVMDSKILQEAADALKANMKGEEVREAMTRAIGRAQQEHIELAREQVNLTRRQIELLEGVDKRLRVETQRLRERDEREERRRLSELGLNPSQEGE